MIFFSFAEPQFKGKKIVYQDLCFLMGDPFKVLHLLRSIKLHVLVLLSDVLPLLVNYLINISCRELYIPEAYNHIFHEAVVKNSRVRTLKC